jgi:hypothetical protein
MMRRATTNVGLKRDCPYVDELVAKEIQECRRLAMKGAQRRDSET